MKRRNNSIFISVLIVLCVSILAFSVKNNKSVSYSITEQQICQNYGYSRTPNIEIHLNPDGGSVSFTDRVYNITHIHSNDLPKPKKSGYTFQGWYLYNQLLDYKVDYIQVPYYLDGYNVSYYHCYPQVNLTVIAKWASRECPNQKAYPVHFQTNGGSSVANSTTTNIIAYYQNGTMPVPTRSGYTFAGWYVDIGLNKPFNGSNYNTTSYYDNDGCISYYVTLYAKWVASVSCPSNQVYNLYYNSNGGTSIPMERKEGSSVVFAFPTPTKSGYTFDGWYKDSGFKNKAVNNQSGIYFSSQQIDGCPVNVGTVYAKWVKVSLPNSGPGSGAQQNPNPDPVPTPTPAPNPSNSGGGSSHKESEVHTCPNVINYINISFNSDGGTELEDFKICLTCGEEDVTLPQPEKEGKNFVGWYTDESLENEVIVDGLNTEVQLTQFKLIVDKNDDGCDSDTARTTLYARYEDATCETPDIAYLNINFVTGDEVDRVESVKKGLYTDDFYELPILEKEDYVFGGWYIDAEYSRLVSRVVNVYNAAKYMNVTRDFVNGCSTDTISTILYAKWIPEEEIKSVRIMFISQGSIVDERLYNLSDDKIDLPDLKVKGYKLLGWYTDSSYQHPITNMKELLADSYGFEIHNGQLFLYAYAKTEDVKGFSSNTAIVGIAIVVFLGILYIISSSNKERKNKQRNNNMNNNRKNSNVGNRVTWHT